MSPKNGYFKNDNQQQVSHNQAFLRSSIFQGGAPPRTVAPKNSRFFENTKIEYVM